MPKKNPEINTLENFVYSKLTIPQIEGLRGLTGATRTRFTRVLRNPPLMNGRELEAFSISLKMDVGDLLSTYRCAYNSSLAELENVKGFTI